MINLATVCVVFLASAIIMWASVSFTSEVTSEVLPQLKVSGRWVVDSTSGNVMLLRGVNVMNKQGLSPEAMGFDEEDVILLAKRGFTLVRLGIFWQVIQPFQYGVVGDRDTNIYNYAYLESIKRTVNLLARNGIYTLIDFHQDAMN